MTPEQKQHYWQQHIKGWQQSQCSQKAYCHENNLSFASFGYWRTRLNRLAQPEKKLIPVTLPRTTGLINIYLPSGIRMEVPVPALAEVLPMICRSGEALS